MLVAKCRTDYFINTVDETDVFALTPVIPEPQPGPQSKKL